MHPPRHRRLVPTLLATLAVALSGAAAFAPPAQAAISDIKINEVESNGGTPGDWVELINNGSTAQDIGGLKFRDSDSGDPTHLYTIPTGTSIPAGGYFILEEAAFGYGLGAADSANLYLADGTTVVDQYAWTAHAASTYGRCPNGTGAFTSTTSSKSAANTCVAATPSIKVNEVESNGGTPGDWVELKNTGTTAADVGGLKFRDNDDADPTHLYTIPTGTTVAAGGYYVLEEAALGYGLGAADSARLYQSDGTTIIDQYSWTAHASTTYGRCPDGTGAFATTQVVTKGAVNNCVGDLVYAPWPGGANVSVADQTAFVSSNLSGLYYQGTGTSTPGTLWAVQNGGPEALHKLVKSGSEWVPDAGWTGGKQLRYPSGTGQPDAEGVTFTGTPSEGVFVATERDNGNNGVSRPAIERYDPTATGSSLTATGDWNLTADLPGLGANLGLEGIAWVPDSYLTAKGFKTSAGTTYNPAAYANHGSGLFFVGVEATGQVIAYALDLNGTAFTRVATIDSGFSSVMEVHWEAETQKLWVVCDDTCQGRTARFDVQTATGAGQGTFVSVERYERPTGMANLNNEGFTTTPRRECSGGVKPVFWADDGDTGGNSLRVGTLNCTDPLASTTTVAVTGTTIRATVAATTGTPTGTVTFKIDGVVAGTASVTAGVAQLTRGVPTGGTRTVTAEFNGGPDNLPSSGSVTRRDPQLATAVASTQPRSSTGWYRTPVTVTFVCTPQGSALSAPCPSPVTLSTSGADQSITGTVTAADGGSATATVTDLDIDLVAPTVAVGGAKAGKTYNKKRKPRCVGSDGLSGIATCTVSQKKKGNKYVVTATATDRAGNVSTKTLTYKVRPKKKK